MADEDVPARVARLEQQVDEIRADLRESKQDSAAARVLGAGADRDSQAVRDELRAHNRVLEALRQTQVEQGVMLERQASVLDLFGRSLGYQAATLDQHSVTLDQHSATLAEHTVRLDQHTVTLAKHTVTLDQHTATLDQHTEMLGGLQEGVARILSLLTQPPDPAQAA